MARKQGIDEGFSKYVVLARLYALGDRLQASTFQRTVLQAFVSGFSASLTLPAEAICDLLGIACEQLRDGAQLDPLRAQIFWFAASKMDRLQTNPYFRTMLKNQEDLGKTLCLWAGNTSHSQPSASSEKPQYRFKPESIYQ